MFLRAAKLFLAKIEPDQFGFFAPNANNPTGVTGRGETTVQVATHTPLDRRRRGSPQTKHRYNRVFWFCSRTAAS